MNMNFERYESRFHAGRKLITFLKNNDNDLYKHLKTNPNKCFCFAIPNGGVPVAEGFCTEMKLYYDLLIVRKIKIPYNPEAGFGSITPDGTVLLNKELLAYLNLNKEEIDESIEITKQEIQDRLKFYHKQANLIEDYNTKINNKKIFLIDDGLASGFTMLAAIKMVKNYNPEEIFVLTPTAPYRSIQRIEKKVKKVFCPNIRKVMRFAVADAYKNWYDVPESEVIDILNQSKYYSN
jgi:predicted phosphoribosyltransferase